MTSFLDIIRPLTEQLENLSNKAKSAVGKYDSDTSNFQRYVTDNINGATGTVQFLGQGADACVAAVGRNVNRSHHVITKLGDFQLACQQTKEDLEEMSRPFDQESVYRDDMLTNDTTGDQYATTVSEFFLEGQGYSPYDTTNLSSIVIWRIREDTLPGLSWQLDTLLTPGKGQQTLEDDVEYGFQCIDGDFKSHLAQKHDELDYAHSHGMDDEAYKYYSSHADGMYHLAIHYVRVIADKMKKGYAEWVTEFQAMVGQFQLDLAAAAAINDPSLGNLISQINSGPNANAKVLVWQTPNGLIVVIKDGADPAAVEAALKAQYGNMPITLIGYKGGSEAAQQIVL
ncbi:MAG TPA: hypothetical protein VFN35_09100, partial [Ktedonobacteraceae bacterium]|nr:hypothetical protein [Ktedonobacteraceae bacterium]